MSQLGIPLSNTTQIDVPESSTAKGQTVKADAVKPKWKFPLTNGGQEDGFNDPGINTFAGDYAKYLAREATQNVIDAKRKDEDAVVIKFQLRNIESNKLPGYTELKQNFESCAKYYPNDKKCIDFFEAGLKVLAARTIPVLSISDFNTTGLKGLDKDRDGNWYALIRSIGSSQKSSNAGGSFGIGKNAPFAASSLRTVFYSTKVEDGSVAFQGVARLISHLDGKGKTTQGTGYFGPTDSDNYPEAIRSEDAIHPFFKRSQQGTDIHIIGYEGGKEWKKELERAILEDFWPAIHWGKLIVEIDDIVINSTTLQEKMTVARTSDESFYEDAYAYYNAYVNPDHKEEKTLKHLKQVRVHYKIGDADLPNRVAMIRRTGMVIFKAPFPRLRIKFSGAFICDNEDGNSLLRSMEPPRHDIWDVNLPKKGAGVNVQREYREWLRGILKSLSPTSEAKELEVDELADYLPDSPSADANAEKGEISNGQGDAFTSNPVSINSPRVEVKASPPPIRKSPTTLDPDSEEKTSIVDERATGEDHGDEGSESNGEEDGGSEDRKPRDGEINRHTTAGRSDSEKPQKSNSNRGGTTPSSRKKSASLVARGFADASQNEYIINLRSDTNTTVGASIVVVGEDAFTERITLLKARDKDTNDVVAVSGNSIDQVKLLANVPRRIAVSFGDSVHYAININVYEV